MLWRLMLKQSWKLLLLLPVLTAFGIVSGCGTQELSLPASEKNPQIRHGAVLFSQRCSGCHTLSVAGTHGSASSAKTSTYTTGPNFNYRKETYGSALFAIRNGGFSAGPMPANVVVGNDAKAVAKFLAKYSGKEAPPTTPSTSPSSSSSS
jgi:mono/diheme cytochrome c family protein